jgi:hypothetical protein|tara:strand:+ start:123 stop:647 length:525 start_codon:yes stop_codon:yes gene_type:complete
MSLAIETPRGQKSLEYERECISLFCNLYPQFKFLETDKHSPAAIDGIMYLHRDGIMTAAVEVKCRNMTHEQLFGDYGGEWLVANSKIEKGRSVSYFLSVPFVGMLYLIPEKTIYTLPITDKQGNYIVEFDVRETTTKATINGGKVKQPNAFLPMDKAKEHKCTTKPDAENAKTK